MNTRWLVILSLFGLAPNALARPEKPPTVREAQQTLRMPRGSLSLGLTNKGTLRHGVALPVKGRGFAVFPHFVRRETRYGTRELVLLIKRVARKMAKRFPGAVLGIGNLSREGGGQTGGSVSHKSGRDADIGMYARTAKGRPVNLKGFRSFYAGGWDKRRRSRFDFKRNLALVEALVMDTKAPVQFIFVADWLKKGMLAEAARQGLAAEVIKRIEIVCRQPSDSNPHHHHFHVRIYCSVQDRLHGCLERGAVHPWVNLGDDRFNAHVKRIIRLLQMSSSRWRRRAVEALGSLRAVQAVASLVQALEDRHAGVRKSALVSLGQIRSPLALDPLKQKLTQVTGPELAAALVKLIGRLPVPDRVPLARKVILAPTKALHGAVAKQPGPVWMEAAKILRRHGRKTALKPLRKLLLNADQALRQLAHEGLRHVTNQPIGRRLKRRSRASKWARAMREWNAFFEKHANGDWLAWMKLGFEARGTTFATGPLTRAAVPQLIALVRDRERTVWMNAARTLSALTGHVAPPWWRTQRNNHRHWKSYWKGVSQGKTKKKTP